MRLITLDTEYVQPGIAASYLRVEGGEAAFIDTNTTHAVPRLLEGLRQAGLAPEQVRYVIATHVHLDHAGGAGALLRHCPNAILVAHPRAGRHLIDPAKLVASATGVYGAERFARLYGEIVPAPAERVRTVEDGEVLELGGAQLRFLHTRGHANHHVAIHDPARDTVYTGDTFGLAYPRLQRAGRFAFFSTSPTDFDPAEARRSVERIRALGTATACPTHFGEIDRLDVVESQLHWWIDRSEALVEEAAGLEPEEAARFLRRGVEAAMEEAMAQVGLSVQKSDADLLAVDVELNAQGLEVAAAKRRSAA